NAAKFMPEAGEVRIEIVADPASPDRVQVTVSNPGEGIAADALPRLFSRYFQAPSGQQRNGYGLGLAICKQNIEMHGGKIEVESIPQKLTTFRFWLPIGRPYLLLLSADKVLQEQVGAGLAKEWRRESV